MSNTLDKVKSLAAEYRRDGAICVPNVLDSTALAETERYYNWSITHPSPSACEFFENDDGTFYQDQCHPDAAINYREFLEQTILADVVAALWGTDEVWILYEQVFLKEGTKTRRTPWHQDSSYLALDGEHIAVVWVNFDPVRKDQSLEFVRGSHLTTLYDGSAFDADDPTKPVYGKGLPRLPDIESDRANWDIVSWAVNPGDVVVFHPSTLHGGSPTDGLRRRTLSLRLFGPDAVYAVRPKPALAPLVAGLHDNFTAGQAFRHVAFPRLRPTPAGFEQVSSARAHTVSVKTQMQAGAID